DPAGAEVGVPVGPRAEGVPGVVAVDEVDPSGDRLHPVDQPHQLLAAGVEVAGVEAEADHRGVRRAGGHRVPEAGDTVERAGHRIAAARGVLDQYGDRALDPLENLAPVVEADLRIVAGVDVPAVHDQTLGADGGGGL